jgi:alkaline phosphatase
MKKLGLLFSLPVIIFFLTSCTSSHTDEEKRPQNIILLIGDGMSFAHVQAGILASENQLNLEQFTDLGIIQTSSANNFITDSGAAGTAIASGVKTNNGFIGMDPDGNPVKSILHLAAESGLATGIVVSCALTHATPASFVAQQPSRNMGEEIALDFLSYDIDVLIGGGRNHFTRREDGRDLLKELESEGYIVASSMEEVKEVSSGKLAGIIADNHPPKYSENRGDMLPDGTLTALNILSRNPGGFFLMVEGAQIDWGGHDNDIDYIVNEMLDFDRAVGHALEFARENGETLVIVTSDHETGGMAIHGFDSETGKITAGWTTGGHTGLMQPVFAWGPGSDKFRGIYENTGVFDRMLVAFGFSKN